MKSLSLPFFKCELSKYDTFLADFLFNMFFINFAEREIMGEASMRDLSVSWACFWVLKGCWFDSIVP